MDNLIETDDAFLIYKKDKNNTFVQYIDYIFIYEEIYIFISLTMCEYATNVPYKMNNLFL